MNTVKKLVFVSALMVSLTGCQSTMDSISSSIEEGYNSVKTSINNRIANNRRASFDNSTDQELLKAFYSLSENGLEQTLTSPLPEDNWKLQEVSEVAFSVEKKLHGVPNMDMALNFMNKYSYDAESDAMSKIYIDAANARGNSVSVYRPSLAKKVNSLFPKAFGTTEQSRQWYSTDIVLMERNSAGRPISILVRAVQAYTALGVTVDHYATVYFGTNNMRKLENNIGNHALNDAFMREYTAN